MRNRLLHPATIIATIALFVALSGTSYAISQLPRNSVGTPQLKRNAVTGAKVKDGSLSARDFATGTLVTGATGPAGPKGDTGATGPAGPTASASAMDDDNGTQAMSGTTLYGILDTGDAGQSGPLTVTVPTRITATASVVVYKRDIDHNKIGDVSCYIVRRSTQSPFSIAIGPPSRVTLMNVATLPAAGPLPAVAATVSVSAEVTLTYGSWNFEVVCQNTDLSGINAGNKAEAVQQYAVLNVVGVAT